MNEKTYILKSEELEELRNEETQSLTINKNGTIRKRRDTFNFTYKLDITRDDMIQHALRTSIARMELVEVESQARGYATEEITRGRNEMIRINLLALNAIDEYGDNALEVFTMLREYVELRYRDVYDNLYYYYTFELNNETHEMNSYCYEENDNTFYERYWNHVKEVAQEQEYGKRMVAGESIYAEGIYEEIN